MKWTEAGQITSILGWPESEDDGLAPEVFFDALRASGRHDDAVMFLCQALPRYEAVAWAARSVRELAAAPPSKGDQDALKSTFLWLQDPSDNRRRAAFDAASEISEVTPARLCALAVFFSGGSLAPPTVAPVPSPKEAAGKFAAGAVLAAATRSGRRREGLQQALALGDAIAAGTEAARP